MLLPAVSSVDKEVIALVHGPTDTCRVLHLQHFGLLSSFFQSQ